MEITKGVGCICHDCLPSGIRRTVLRFLELDDNENVPLVPVWQGIVFLGIGFVIPALTFNITQINQVEPKPPVSIRLSQS